MKKKRFSTEQIVAVLKQAEMGLAVRDFRANLLPLEEAIWRTSVGTGPRAQAAGRGEWSTEEIGC
jgi:hypothetical protein